MRAQLTTRTWVSGSKHAAEDGVGARVSSSSVVTCCVSPHSLPCHVLMQVIRDARGRTDQVHGPGVIGFHPEVYAGMFVVVCLNCIMCACSAWHILESGL